MNLHLAILRLAGRLVPSRERVEWMKEWRSELWYVRQARDEMAAAAFCLGAFKDAFWIRRDHFRLEARKIFRLESPLKCGIALAAVASVTSFLAFRATNFGFDGEPLFSRWFILPHLLMIALAVMILPSSTPLSLGEYPANNHSPSLLTRLRRWFFFGIKILLIVQIVACLSISSLGFRVFSWLVYLLAFRWALVDQRQRCPVCLRSLSQPTTIGWPSEVFLEWYGTELMCLQGHGLLYVPEILTSSYDKQRWLYLDPSWNGLFSVGE